MVGESELDFSRANQRTDFPPLRLKFQDRRHRSYGVSLHNKRDSAICGKVRLGGKKQAPLRRSVREVMGSRPPGCLHELTCAGCVAAAHKERWLLPTPSTVTYCVGDGWVGVGE